MVADVATQPRPPSPSFPQRANPVAAGPAALPVPASVEALLRDVAVSLSAVPSCVALVLYGSAARGELRAQSDLDLLALFEVDHRSELGPEAREVSKRLAAVEARHDLPWPVSCVLASADLEGLEADYLTWIAAEGKTLWVRPDYVMRLTAADGRLEPYVLVAFDQSQLSPAARVGLHRALFGYRTTKQVKEKRYVSEHAGIVQFPGQRLGPGVLLLPAHQERPVVNALERCGVTYGRTPVWR